MLVVGDGGSVSVFGLAAQINITGFEANDRIVINALAGDDVIEASGLGAGASSSPPTAATATTSWSAATGNDILIGGAGDDVLIGGRASTCSTADPATTS